MSKEEFNLSKEVDKWLDRQGVCINSLQKSNLKQTHKEFIKRLKENLIGLFDVYEIKVVNEGNELFLRDHEKRRMIISEINKLTGDALVLSGDQEEIQ